MNFQRNQNEFQRDIQIQDTNQLGCIAIP